MNGLDFQFEHRIVRPDGTIRVLEARGRTIVDENGKAIAQNVFCAGGAIAGYDPSGTKSRGGMAIATGYRAAREALAA